MMYELGGQGIGTSAGSPTSNDWTYKPATPVPSRCPGCGRCQHCGGYPPPAPAPMWPAPLNPLAPPYIIYC